MMTPMKLVRNMESGTWLPYGPTLSSLLALRVTLMKIATNQK